MKTVWKQTDTEKWKSDNFFEASLILYWKFDFLDASFYQKEKISNGVKGVFR